ncbi:Pre-mRNA cleavage complex II protein Clp1-domain-containing protein [Desarmillaria ectypa]|nr:Pre-mRNA cleavage complex II protein Clp1-domain-containing protein [Desarmillaria ectypa]
MTEDTPETKEWVLEPETEYRFELDPGTSLAVKLSRGHAEIFGFELVEGQTYVFGAECKGAIFTWQGCIIEVTGHPSTDYVSEETPMNAYGNLHVAFEQMRVRALRTLNGSPPPDTKSDVNAEPPRVLILGPENSGKTSVCKILVNYAVRAGQGWTPLLVNLDPSEGGWSAPGALSVAPVSSPLPTSSPANILGTAATSAPTSLSSNALLPLVYWYGHQETRKNTLLMDRLIRNLGENVRERQDNDPRGGAAGIIVDTPSSLGSGPASSAEHRQRLIKACIESFRINVILVVGHEKLNVEMQRAYGSRLTVVKIPKSGGVVELDHGYRERVHNYQMHTYMYGQVIQPPAGIPASSVNADTFTDVILSPSSSVINFDDLIIYRIGAATMAPSDALPVGAKRVVSETQPVLVNPSQAGSGLLNAVLALLSPFNPDENERYDEEILDLTVVGFLVITKLDIPQRKMTILAPNQGSLVGKTAIVGSYEWQDQ